MILKISKKDFAKVMLSLNYTICHLIDAMHKGTTSIKEGKKHVKQFRKLRDLLLAQVEKKEE